MKCKTAISFLLIFFVTASLVYAGESVTFKGTSKTVDAFMINYLAASSGVLTAKPENPFRGKPRGIQP